MPAKYANTSRVRLAVIGIVLVAALAYIALLQITGDSERNLPRLPEARTHDEHVKLSVRLGWLVNANSAGQIVAQARGFYREEGLVVEFREGGLVDPSVKTVASGLDDIGFANGPDLVINARANCAPLKLFGVIHSSGYHGFLVREDSKIVDPRDWTGHRVGIKIGSPTYALYLALLNKYGVDRSSIEEVPLGFDLQPFIDGRIDVYPGATTNEQITLALQGIKTRAILPSDHGFPTMGNVVFATDANCRDHPDILRRFLRATIRGWEWCRVPEHREEVLDYLQQVNPALDRKKEGLSLAASVELVGDGSIDKGRLKAIIDVLRTHANIRGEVSADTLSFDAFAHESN